MTNRYVNLHVHSYYSFLDGLSSIDDIVNRAVELAQEAVALTDHGSMMGAVEFYKKCKAKGIKPIIGNELYVTYDTSAKGKNREVNGHLLALAKNNVGYENLMKLTTESYNNFYHRPRVTRELLEKYKEGIIISSACLSSPFRKAWMPDSAIQDPSVWISLSEDLISIFKESFLLETQTYNSDEQRLYNYIIRREAKSRKLNIIATNDSHYTKKGDFELHDILLAMQTRKYLDDPNRMRHLTNDLYLHSAFEMRDFPENEIENTAYIAKICNYDLDFSHKFPKVDNAFLNIRNKCLAVLEKKKLNDKPEYVERLENELSVLEKTKFADYFLILENIVNWAKTNSIYTGAGRGSSAGSLICYLLNITAVDPVKHNLLFERFLNVSRVGLPDIDVDFEDARRGEVIDYITETFGKDKTANICTVSKMGIKQAVKDYLFVKKVPFEESNRLTNSIPQNTKSINELPYHSNLPAKIDAFIGIPRQASTHASAMVIAPDNINKYTPIMKIDDRDITMYDMYSLENIGLVKFDILGLKNLTVIRKTIELAEKRGVNKENILQLIARLNDKVVLKMIADGFTLGCFQIETSGITGLCKALPVSSFEDIVHVISLYRPAVIDTPMLKTYLNNRKHPGKIKYVHNDIASYLSSTCGILLFQEQMMNMAMDMAKFSASEADELRKGIGKKKPEILQKMKDKFVAGCLKNYPIETANELFSLIEAAGNYSFNRSHAVAYAMTTYATAWLKFYFPLDFMTCLINEEKDHEKVSLYLHELKRLAINVLPPDINKSEYETVIENKDSVRMGFKIIKGIGENVGAYLLTTRNNKVFDSLDDFLFRYSPGEINTKSLVALVTAGCFDSICTINKHTLLTSTDGAEEQANMAQIANALKLKINTAAKYQYCLDIKKEIDSLLAPFRASTTQLTDHQQMTYDNLAFGFSMHNPLEENRDFIEKTLCSMPHIKKYPPNTQHVVAGIISNVKEGTFKTKGTNSVTKNLCRFKLRTLDGLLDCIIFAEQYNRCKMYIQDSNFVIVACVFNSFKGAEGLKILNAYPFVKNMQNLCVYKQGEAI